MARDERAGGGHADEHRAGPLADGGARLLAERGVRLVADHDRVGVRDLARVAHEPLVGLDGHRSARRRLVAVVAQQRRGDAVAVAAVAQLAQELVHEVAAVGEDQDAAGARRLGEAERGHGLAGPGGVLEPEAPAGARVLQDGVRGCLLLGLLGRVPVERLLVGELVALQLHLAGGQLLGRGTCAVAARACCGTSSSAVSAISVPESASTWCADSTVPSTRCGSSSDSTRSSPSDQRVVAPPLPRTARRGRRRARPARRRARRGGPCPRRARSRRPRLRARTARARTPRRAARSSPETGAVFDHRASFSHGWASLFRETDGPGNAPRRISVPPLVSRVRPSYSPLSYVPSGERAESIRNCRRTYIVAHGGPIAAALAFCHPGRMRRRPGPRLRAALLAGCSSSEPGKSASTRRLREARRAPPPARRALSPAERAARRRAGAFDERIAKLRGHPVVVNTWASWCGPCRFEFPFFQKQAVKRGKQVAFLGVNSQDNKGDAQKFLDDYPLPFPSYEDPDGRRGAPAQHRRPARHRVLRPQGRAGLPTPGWIRQRGRSSAEDIERYAR